MLRDVAGAFFGHDAARAVKLHEEHVRFYAAETVLALETFHHYNVVYQ